MVHPKKLRRLHISRLFPNMITLAGLCCGLTAMRYAFSERWELAIILLLAAAILDGMDGRVARMLNSASTFGAQLDSLSDIVCFGVVPAILLYLWQMHEVRGIGWACALFFAVCTALRLARFNTRMAEDKPQALWEKQFFVGVPAPAGAMLCILPIIFTLQFGEGWLNAPALTIIYVTLVAVLMASRIPTFSLKKLHIRHEMVLPTMLLVGMLVVFFIIEPWSTILTLGALYFISIFFSVRRYRQLAASPEAQLQDNDEEDQE